jgi:hypothetical protein
MSHIVEADDQGSVLLSSELLKSKPHARYEVKVRSGEILLRPLIKYPPGWEELTPQQRVERLKASLAKLPGPSPSDVHLTDEQLRRENIYD